MKYTVIQFAYDGCVEGDCPPVVRKGHMTLEEATAFAEEYGDEYDWVSCVPCSNDSAAFYANFSHDEKPPLDDDGAVQEEFKGSLELWFYHDELQKPKDDRKEKEIMNQERFKIKRLGGRPGADKPGDAYAIMAPSFEPETGTKLPDSAFTIIVGTDRSEATRFCALLNNACELFENGVLQ